MKSSTESTRGRTAGLDRSRRWPRLRGTELALAVLTALVAREATAARVTIGTGSGAPGGGANVEVTFAAEGASVAILEIDLLVSSPLSFSSATTGPAASAAGKQITTSTISGGVKMLVFGLNQTALGDGSLSTVTYAIAGGASSGTYPVTIGSVNAASPSGATVAVSGGSGSVNVQTGASLTSSWILPSCARAAGVGGAFFTTELSIANTGGTNATVVVKFLGHDQDGRAGVERTYSIAAGRTFVITDLLASFNIDSGFGGVQVKGSVDTLVVNSQTSTPAPNPPGGSFGQSIPAFSRSALIPGGTSRSLIPVRQDGSFRSNLVLVNGTESDMSVDVFLISGDGVMLGARGYDLRPLEMIQKNAFVRNEFGVTTDVQGARLVVSPRTVGGGVAVFVSAVANGSNDPRTLLPQ